MALIYTYHQPNAPEPDKRQIRWHTDLEKFLVREFNGKWIVRQGTCNHADLPQHLADEAIARSRMSPAVVAISYLDWPLD